jgi:hypothetical protein
MTITIDGNPGDWDWFPDAAAIGIEDAYAHACQIEVDEHLGTPNCEVNTADFDWTIKVAWAPEPDNRIYFLAEVFDDVWMFPEEPGPGAMHNYDCFELVVDPDASGGTAGMTRDDEDYYGRYGQQYYVSAGFGETDHQFYCIYIAGPGETKQASWMDVAPYAEMAFVREGNTGYYEGTMALFDFMAVDGPDASVRTMLEVGKTIGLGFLCDEKDHVAGTYDAQWKTHSGTSSWKTADEIPDFVMLPAGEAAVQPGTWGVVKSLFK